MWRDGEILFRVVEDPRSRGVCLWLWMGWWRDNEGIVVELGEL